MRSTGGGTLEPPVANTRSQSQQRAAPSPPCCYKKHTTMSRTSRTSAMRTRTSETWPSSSTRTRSYQTRGSTRSLKNQQAGPHGVSRPWMSVDICADHQLVPQDSHILHEVVARKRDAATSLLQRLCAHMRLLDVDFVGGDFNMAAKGTVADMFSDPEFKAPGTTPLWSAGGLEGALRTAPGFHACHADRSTGASTHTDPHILQRQN